MRNKFYTLVFLFFLFINCKEKNDFIENYLCKYNWYFIDELDFSKNHSHIFYSKFSQNGYVKIYNFKTGTVVPNVSYKWIYKNDSLFFQIKLVIKF